MVFVANAVASCMVELSLQLRRRRVFSRLWCAMSSGFGSVPTPGLLISWAGFRCIPTASSHSRHSIGSQEVVDGGEMNDIAAANFGGNMRIVAAAFLQHVRRDCLRMRVRENCGRSDLGPS